MVLGNKKKSYWIIMWLLSKPFYSRYPSNSLHRFYRSFCKKRASYCIISWYRKGLRHATKKNILSTLIKGKITEKMLIFLHNFLLDRKFQVKLKNVLSDYLKIEWFASIINDIFNNLQHLIIYTLFTDEYNVYCRRMNMKTSAGLLQTTIKSLQHGTSSTGFKRLSSKT